MRRRANEPDVAVLDIWQQNVLLRLVEPVDFVDEQNGGLAGVGQPVGAAERTRRMSLRWIPRR